MLISIISDHGKLYSQVDIESLKGALCSAVDVMHATGSSMYPLLSKVRPSYYYYFFHFSFVECPTVLEIWICWKGLFPREIPFCDSLKKAKKFFMCLLQRNWFNFWHNQIVLQRKHDLREENGY